MGQILIALLAIGVALLFHVEAESYPDAASQFPSLIGWVVGLLAVIAIVNKILQMRTQSASGAQNLFTAPDWRAAGTGALFLVLAVLYVWGLQTIGFLISTPLFIGACLLALKAVRPMSGVIAIVLVTGIIWLMFFQFLGLSIKLLPWG